MSKRLGSTYRSGRVNDWLKIKNPAAPAVRREAEEDWNGRWVEKIAGSRRRKVRTVLFLCTGNYYRSRFAEELFNHHAERAQASIGLRSRGVSPWNAGRTMSAQSHRSRCMA